MMIPYVLLYPVLTVLTFAAVALILRRLIPALASKKMGQKILDIGPRWHKNKEGTPTMGGLSFLFTSLVLGGAAIAVVTVNYGIGVALPLIITLSMALLSGLIGIVDDYAKLRHAANEGLKAWQKFGLQVILSALYLFAMRLWGGLTTEMYFPYFNATVDMGIFYYPVALLLLCGVMNSVNLTDGIDGLASTVTAVVSAFFGLCAYIRFSEFNVNLAVVSALGLGCTLGFLVYNFYPARVFMGDTGSLFLGGLVIGGAFLMNNPLIILLAGLVYIIETASVMLQVSYFKLTHGKRLFKMSPIHHHFEKCGWSEIKIVVIFSLATVVFCAIAWFGVC